MMRTKKAEAGIGTLILFIALILVAAIAAGVLVATASSLQSKALFTGTRAQAQVSSQAVPVSMYGKDASAGSPRQLNRSFFKLKLAPGSDPIKLSEAVLQVDTNSQRATLSYSSSLDCTVETTAANGLFNATANPSNATHFGVRYLIGGSSSGYIERQDIVELCFVIPGWIGEGENLRVTFSPKIGSPTIVETKTPDVMLDQRVTLYP